MVGKKTCKSCGIQVPIAQKICECGVPFIKGKKCVKCNRIVPYAKKTCVCNYVFKQRKKSGFQEMPIVLTTDRLRPTRPIRAKRPLYNDCDYIYNVSMSALPKQRRGNNGRDFAGERLDELGGVYEHDELYDKDLNDAALESIANTDDSKSNGSKSNVKNKMYPKRDRSKSRKYQYFSSMISKRAYTSTNKMDKETEAFKKTVIDSKKTSTDGEKHGINGRVTFENGLRRLIYGDVSNSLKGKVSSDSAELIGSSMMTDDIKELQDDDSCKEASSRLNAMNRKVMVKGKNNVDIELKCEETFESLECSESKVDFPKKDYNSDDISDDDKTLKEIKYQLTGATKDGSGVKSVKKKCGRPRIHPIRPKKPIGRPRKYPADLPRKYRRKYAQGVLSNLNEIVDLSKEEKNKKVMNEINDSILKTMKPKLSNNSFDKKEIKRGRPKGCKDSKPRKIRNDYIERLVARKVDVEGLLSQNSGNQKPKSNKCLLSPPSLMSGKKGKHVENEILDPEEIERIEKRLNKTNPFIIPDCKKELYSTILDEINRRISSQSFQSSLLIQDI